MLQLRDGSDDLIHIGHLSSSYRSASELELQTRQETPTESSRKSY